MTLRWIATMALALTFAQGFSSYDNVRTERADAFDSRCERKAGLIECDWPPHVYLHRLAVFFELPSKQGAVRQAHPNAPMIEDREAPRAYHVSRNTRETQPLRVAEAGRAKTAIISLGTRPSTLTPERRDDGACRKRRCVDPYCSKKESRGGRAPDPEQHGDPEARVQPAVSLFWELGAQVLTTARARPEALANELFVEADLTRGRLCNRCGCRASTSRLR